MYNSGPWNQWDQWDGWNPNPPPPAPSGPGPAYHQYSQQETHSHSLSHNHSHNYETGTGHSGHSGHSSQYRSVVLPPSDLEKYLRVTGPGHYRDRTPVSTRRRDIRHSRPLRRRDTGWTRPDLTTASVTASLEELSTAAGTVTA